MSSQQNISCLDFVFQCIVQYRHEGTELQMRASRHYAGRQLTGASTHAQSRQQANPAHKSVPNCANQDRQQVPELQQQQQQQLDTGSPASAAVHAEASSCHRGHADLNRLADAPKQQSCRQLNARPASSTAFEACVSAELGSGGAGPGWHAEYMGDDMCDPMELTWEGVLHAASANQQEPRAPGDALPPCSSRTRMTGVDNDSVEYQYHLKY